MSKKGRRAHTATQAARAGTARGGRAFRRHGLIAFGGAVLAASIVIAIRHVVYSGAGNHMPFPPPAPLVADTAVTHADFVGAEACASCHPSQYELWKRSTHGRAGGPPSPDLVKAPFNGPPLRFRDAVVIPSVTESGAYVFTVAQEDRPAVEFRVDAVVGGGYMIGGGTQAFFSKFPDGTLRFLPFDYSLAEHLWFCATAGRADRGLVPITPAIALADCQDWPPTRVLGSLKGFQACQQCHGSQVEAVFDSVAKRYATRFTSLAINCESCHGPGQHHVELARSGRIAGGADIGMRSLATLTKNQSLQVCFQCHAVKTTLEPQYLPGRNLEQYFALKFPLLLDTLYFPDGRTRTFAYQEGHLASACYLQGSMTCTDCHEPHGQGNRDVFGRALEGRFDDQQCLACHPSKAERPEVHTFHPAASPGSRCVACHMPYLQQPSAGQRVRYARSDHTISIPRPLFDTRLAVENACQQCHREQTVDELEAQVTAWYGELKPQPRAVAALLAGGGRGGGTRAARTTISLAGDRHPMAEFAGLTHLLEAASPDMGTPDEETRHLLMQRATSTDPDEQGLALAILHLAHGADPEVRRFLANQLRQLGPRDGIVRKRWAWILEIRGEAYMASGAYESALAVFRKWQELEPEEAGVFRALGVAYSRLGDYPTAIEQFWSGLALNPSEPQTLLELGFALMQNGNLDAAEAAYRQAIAANPWSAGGYANLGVAYLMRSAVQPAVEVLEKAVELRPGLAGAHFALASAYAELGQLEAAVTAIERGLEFDPENVGAQRMLEAFHRQRPP
jgi:tetratricopeptide (TPR) repeat protein